MRKSVCYVWLAVVGMLVSGQTARADDQPAVKKFVNTKDGRTGKLLENYVDFSFNYPASWKIVEAGVNNGNFVKLDRSSLEGDDRLTQENFAVGNFSGSGNAESDKKLIPQFIAQLENQFKVAFPNYKKTSEGPTKFGSYKGSELRFTSEIEHPEKGPIKYWGRMVVIPNPNGGKKGVLVGMIATSLCPDLKEERDLAVKGELPIIIKSFKLGK